MAFVLQNFNQRVQNPTLVPSAAAFLKVATIQVNLLFTELRLHLSRVKRMYSQPMHLTHELILCIQITKGRVDF